MEAIYFFNRNWKKKIREIRISAKKQSPLPLFNIFLGIILILKTCHTCLFQKILYSIFLNSFLKFSYSNKTIIFSPWVNKHLSKHFQMSWVPNCIWKNALVLSPDLLVHSCLSQWNTAKCLTPKIQSDNKTSWLYHTPRDQTDKMVIPFIFSHHRSHMKLPINFFVFQTISLCRNTHKG